MKALTIAELRLQEKNAKTMKELLHGLTRQILEQEGEADHELGSVVQELYDRREQLLEDAAWLQRKTADISARLERPSLEYHGLNSLGELGHNVAQFDINIALYCHQFSRLTAIVQRRAHEERKQAYAAALNALVSVRPTCVVILNHLKKQASSLSQLAKEFTLPRLEITRTLDLLVTAGFVRIYKGYYAAQSVRDWTPAPQDRGDNSAK